MSDRRPFTSEERAALASQILENRRADYAAFLKDVPAYGPGTRLKSLLRAMGIVASRNCSCNRRARIMDQEGPDWCEANIDTIVGWLREEAEKRGLPFLDIAGRMLVKRAIKLARKDNNQQAEENRNA